jgi:mitogen-activated protein kinase kinase
MQQPSLYHSSALTNQDKDGGSGMLPFMHQDKLNSYPALTIDVHAGHVLDSMSDRSPTPCLSLPASAASLPSGDTEKSLWSPTIYTNSNNATSPSNYAAVRETSITKGTPTTPHAASPKYMSPRLFPASPSNLQQRRSKNQSFLKLSLDHVKEINVPSYSPIESKEQPLYLLWNTHQLFELGEEYRQNLDVNDLMEDQKLGYGSTGDVTKVTHIPTGRAMARKCIRLDPEQTTQQRISRELNVLRACHSPHIVSFYGAFLTTDGLINICMEYMDLGSFDTIYRELGGINEQVIGKIALSALQGLDYLYRTFRIMHRDIKPSNILLNAQGNVKLCDFGVCGYLVNSIAHSFVGTSSYMSPERIQGNEYTVRSDVWSLGLTLMELTIGKFPLPEVTGVFELMDEIVRAPAPRLPSHRYSSEYEDFIAQCLTKDFKERPLPSDLLLHPFIVRTIQDDFDMRLFCDHLMAIRHQKSHNPALRPCTSESRCSCDEGSLREPAI